jgi:D-inositol-3-phosphate glycosyltransferase
MINHSSGNAPLWMRCPKLGRESPRPSSRSFGDKWKQLREDYKKRSTTEYGARVAGGEFNRAALRYLPHDLVLVSPPSMHSEMLRQAALMNRSLGPPLLVSTRKVLLAIAEHGCSAWLDAVGQCAVPFHIRALSSPEKPFPIIVTHHSISYAHLVNEMFLPLVLSDTFHFDAFVCSSHSARRQLQTLLKSITDDVKYNFGAHRQFEGTLEVIPYGVDTNIYRPRDRAATRRKLGLKQNAFVILYVGRISPVDKADLLPFLRIVKDIARAIHPKPLRVLIGGGCHPSYFALLKDYIEATGLSSIVTMLYRIPDQELPEFYSASDVFLSLSDNIQECLGIAAIEALASGIPQVVPDWSGYRDTVDEGVTGYRIPTYWTKCDDDIRSLSPAIPGVWEWSHYNLAQSVAIDLRVLRDRLVTLAIDDAKRLAMGKASVARAHALYGWDVIMRQYAQLIHERVEVSKTCPPREGLGRSPFLPSFFAATKHFATSILEEDSQLSQNDSCIMPLQLSADYIQHFADFEACCPKDPASLLKELPSTDTFEEYRKRVSVVMSCNSDEAIRFIMWLIKYGYLLVNKSADALVANEIPE